MGGACDTCMGEEQYVHDFGGETQMKETT
jgi:hypothetical protein